MIYKTSALLSLALCSSLAVAQTSSYETDDGWRFNPEFSIGAGYGMTKLKDGDFDEDEAAKKPLRLSNLTNLLAWKVRTSISMKQAMMS